MACFVLLVLIVFNKLILVAKAGPPNSNPKEFSDPFFFILFQMLLKFNLKMYWMTSESGVAKTQTQKSPSGPFRQKFLYSLKAVGLMRWSENSLNRYVCSATPNAFKQNIKQKLRVKTFPSGIQQSELSPFGRMNNRGTIRRQQGNG